ncbi:phage regulatory CII family protein [Shewanella surugensis]|uniref:Phage regulatory CII family protein n=1 Tax=Shewanella surugensis TaxID=212020 RepID=A0ABT0LJP5_9GAMM|nr:phage regulatory CII family protein [Shewanella surugensis]MCL1127512.1 phage regulatory CII family protein [Shewanella surugensis]
MYSPSNCKHLHVMGAYRQFASAENLEDVADKAHFYRAQMLRNKLCIGQPHQLTVDELVNVTIATGNRCIIDGVLLELKCAPSVLIDHLQSSEKVALTDRALEINANAATLGKLALDVKVQKRVTERMRHEVMNRGTKVMTELAIFMHEIEQRFQSVPVLSVASDVMQALPMPGL